ncbi:MAG: TetR/AcrR family transcriptional regulator [Sulfuritalea sp.]|nr:TetR/AcrR family transcriptional regulator [Sulfuritalea sp.]MCF8199505.1 TetR/AcrR family transcriptional regulator [Sulfuritalea sp.]
MNTVSTRDKLLEAASRVFLAEGYEATTMDFIRAEAGVSNGSLYHHFPTKAQLAGTLYESLLRDFQQSLLKAISGKTGAEAGVRGLVRAYVRWVVAHPDRARLLHRLRRSSDLADMEAAWSSLNQEASDILREWIARMVAAGEMQRFPFSLWMALVFSPAFALTPQWLNQTPPSVPQAVRLALEDAAWRAVAET